MKFGVIDDSSLETGRIGYWVNFDAFCLDKHIVRRDLAVLGFINMCVLLRLLHQAMEKAAYAKIPAWIDELKNSVAFNSILD